MHRYVNKTFTNVYRITIGADFSTKDIVINDRLITMQIWDTAGQERFQAMGSAFYRGADCCILVYDITNRSSFNSLNSWRDEFLIQANSQDPHKFPFIVLGNKVDLSSHREVPLKAVYQWLNLYDMPYFETSAKDGISVNQAFEAVAKRVLELEDKQEIGDDFTDSIVLNEKPKTNPSSSKCSCS
ncbi:ras-related protein Rab-7a-like isoform X3 [Drosophila innubila]|uniref:ras-related protein Rab-7a-like isoform X3 n=1 Tax=Drosophila innubila TaxID=198719 RepID=UPI00148D5E93|nr:ras-related protein Rab-7a-like isoform X3 [Drosophila innubila]